MTDVPADTDTVIYRPVTRITVDDSGAPVVESVMTPIGIVQP